jgi:hypothetical protein
VKLGHPAHKIEFMPTISREARNAGYEEIRIQSNERAADRLAIIQEIKQRHNEGPRDRRRVDPSGHSYASWRVRVAAGAAVGFNLIAWL